MEIALFLMFVVADVVLAAFLVKRIMKIRQQWNSGVCPVCKTKWIPRKLDGKNTIYVCRSNHAIKLKTERIVGRQRG